MFQHLQMPGKVTTEYYGYGQTELLLFRLAAFVAALPLVILTCAFVVSLIGYSWGFEIVEILVNNFGGMMFYLFLAPALIRSIAAHPFGLNKHMPAIVAESKWLAVLIWALALSGMIASLSFVALNVLDRQIDRTSTRWFFPEALISLLVAAPYAALRHFQETANQREIDANVRGGGGGQ